MAQNTRRRLDEEIAAHEAVKKEVKALRLANSQLHSSVEALEKEKKKSETLEQEKKKLEESYSSLIADFDALQVENENLLQEKASHPNYSNKVRAYDALLVENKRLVDELESLKKIHEDDKRSYIEKAVREYRESKDCFYNKAAYGAGFYKLGFYAARRWLEDLTGDEFPEMIFPQELEDEDYPDWCKYDPRETVTVESCLDQLACDDLDNLVGPWEFHGPHGVRSKKFLSKGDMIPVLGNLDEDIVDADRAINALDEGSVPADRVV